MSWAKIDDRANEHPKLLKAGPKACWAWACGLMYCNRQAKKTGQIPKPVAHGMLFPGIGAREAAKLVEVGLWRDKGDHYEVHEHGQWNSERRPTLTPEELSEIRAEAGRAGGKRSGESRRGDREANEAKAKQSTEPIASDNYDESEKQLLASRTDAPAYAHRRAMDPPHPTPPQEEDPPNPLPEPSPKPDRMLASFQPQSAKRESVQRVHRAWLRAFGLPRNTPLQRGFNTDDADLIGAAVDAYGEVDCVTMLRYAPNDGMVSGRADERGLKHESIRYLFGDNLPRLMRDALAAKERRTGAGSAEAIERRKAAP